MGRNRAREERRGEGESREPPAFGWWQGCHRNCAEDMRMEMRRQAGSPGPGNKWMAALGQAEELPSRVAPSAAS